ncbi:thiol-disulfide isomerase/thioredoxin [Zhongshania antarctica]|jgi:thiol-disulfide isomerase/thioredoxin|uniref:Thiol-disulfide isomerase/thioredoxin n=1 Tax=Zhongshania antarctica TaxID=641702 RepID=A0A840R104_9GAMM|nr:TlpA disulfide reductase family protein [Zhongshania antarctica]MBB5186789.1 thiol-disulfide isomerase/thioredoxin [Zhongshania antarctica]
MDTKPIRSLFFLLLLGISACSKPDFTTIDGKAGQFSQGKWQLINYWATWCGPCREEIPDLNEFAKANTDIKVYGVNYDGLEGEALTAAIAEMGIAFPSLSADPAPQLDVPRPQVLPTTLLLDANGKVRATLTGPQTRESLASAIKRAANQH